MGFLYYWREDGQTHWGEFCAVCQGRQSGEKLFNLVNSLSIILFGIIVAAWINYKLYRYNLNKFSLFFVPGYHFSWGFPRNTNGENTCIVVDCITGCLVNPFYTRVRRNFWMDKNLHRSALPSAYTDPAEPSNATFERQWKCARYWPDHKMVKIFYCVAGSASVRLV